MKIVLWATLANMLLGFAPRIADKNLCVGTDYELYNPIFTWQKRKILN